MTRSAIFLGVSISFSSHIFAAGSPDLRVVQAAKNKDAATVQSLAAQQADVNALQGDGTTAITWAAHWNDLRMADTLLRAGAKVNTISEFGVAPLWEACNNASPEMVEKLLTAGADPNAVLRAGETALMR